MMQSALAFVVLLASAALAHGQASTAQIEFALQGGEATYRLHVQLTIDGASPEVGWQSFLDELLARFDANGDGALSAAEAENVPPLAENAEEESPQAASAQAQPPTDDDRCLGQLFQAALDADRSGGVSRSEWQQAARRLRSFDLNDDEFIARDELLASAQRLSPSPLPEAKNESAEPIVLHINLGAKPAVTATRAELQSSGEGRFVAHGTGLVIVGKTQRTQPDFKTTGDFLAAQLASSLGDRPAIKQAEIAADALLSGLAELFAYADRNRDAQLSPAELTAHLALVERRLRSQTVVRLVDHGQNIFPLLDDDGDGRLAQAELARAARWFTADAAAPLPRIYELEFTAPLVESWGGVAIPAIKPAPIAAPRRDGPSWFTALDRSGDGVVSAREFLGSPARFRQLDADASGLIDASEASAAQ